MEAENGWIEVKEELGVRPIDSEDDEPVSGFTVAKITSAPASLEQILHGTSGVAGARHPSCNRLSTEEPDRIDYAVLNLLLSHDRNTLSRFLHRNRLATFKFDFVRYIRAGMMKISIIRVQEQITIRGTIQTREHELEQSLTKDGQTIKQLLPPHVTAPRVQGGQNYNIWLFYRWEFNIKGSLDDEDKWKFESYSESYAQPWDQTLKTTTIEQVDADIMLKASNAARYLSLVAQKSCYQEEQKVRQRFVVTS